MYLNILQISKLTKVDFNCLNLVVSIDSWVAVLDFFGIAGDDVPDSEHGPEPQQTGNYDQFVLTVALFSVRESEAKHFEPL